MPYQLPAVLSTMSASDYDMLSLHEQIMLRPDTYVGSYDTHRESRWIWDTSAGRMVWREVAVNPALLKLFDEVLVNALDHRVRLQQKQSPHLVKHLDVTVTPNKITVRNDGEGIPVEEHPVHKLYAPEMIFGRLLSSSNYNDAKQERIVGGMNGYGAKLANIFSTEFTVETVDAVRQKRYKQTWTRNMMDCGKASITKATCKPYTEISFSPDLGRFKWEGDAATPTEMPADMVAVLCTRVIDAAACAGKDCRVTLNGAPVASNTFSKYVELYLENAATATIAYEQAGERWEVAAMLTRDLHGDLAPKDRHISFVNGINTRRGGKHVDYVSKTIMAAFCEMAKKKAKLPDLTPALLKDSVVWFLNTTIVNPAFDTQTKECLMTPVDKFGSLPVVSPKFVDKLAKIGLLEEAQMLMDAKTHRDAKKTDGRKKSTVRGIPKLEDAAWAGTARSSDCTLILTEGDSAATTAISGLKVVGRDRYGVFPLKGKILNVKDAPVAQKTANQELTYIKQILGLEHGKSYTDLSQLRYGRIMIMTDQDVDGSHIKGLLMNLFHTEWPSLLKLGFLCCLMTPLLKATKGAQTLCFYSDSEYRAWTNTMPDMRGWKVKYYKGLGTSTAAEAREYFANMNTVEFQWDAGTDGSLDLAFNKKRSDDRKEWLTTYDRARTLQVPAGGAKVGYTRFVNDELIHFSIADNARSIPSVMDGLKPSQRKILWSAMKRNLVSEIKVAQLAGYVSETAAYHHGEASLMGAIIGMAQTFVGSNNVNLLSPNGQFGSRLAGGKDAASPRYIFTALESIVRSLFRREDEGILRYVDDDGQLVEPEAYMPVIPMLLVNGSVGIGTGFSTNVPPFNPVDLIAVLKTRLADPSYELSAVQLTPWWFGFQGSVSAATNKKTKAAGFVTKGLYEFVDDDAALIRIRELPVGTWTHDYRQFLDDMKTEQEEAAKAWTALSKKKDEEKTDKEKAATKPQVWLRDYKNDSNDIDVSFLLEMDPDAYHEARAYPAEFEARFQLTSTFNTTNMVAFDAAGHIHHYKTVGDILDEFYRVRLAAYGERKQKELQKRAGEIEELEARRTFVKAVVEKRLVVAAAEDADILAGMQALRLPPLSAPDSPQDLKAYEYLLRMRVDRLKAAAVQELEREVAEAKSAFQTLSGMTMEQLWLQDLEATERAWGDFVARRRAVIDEAASVKTVAAPKRRGVKAAQKTA